MIYLQRKYNTAATINLALVKPNGADLEPAATFAAGDAKISKDEGAEANTTNLPTDTGTGYSWTITAAELSCARAVIYLVDQSSPKVWLDTVVVIETYGNASAQYQWDLNDSVRLGLTALPNAAAGASGGLPLGDASGRVDLGKWIGTAPLALTSQRVEALVGSMASNVVTAAAVADGAIDRATFAADTGLQTIRSATAQAGAAGSITLDASASATDGYYVDTWVLLTGGTGVGQVRLISGYTGSTKVAAVAPNWTTNPDGTSTFAVLPAGRLDVALWAGAAVNALVSGRVDSSVGAYASGQAPLQPTVAGRTLDVTATGEAGLDLDNTAGTLAKGTDLTGFNDLDAAGVRSAVGLASANLDTQLAALPTGAQIAALILVTPSQKLATDASGRAHANVKAIADDTTAPAQLVDDVKFAVESGTLQAGTTTTATLKNTGGGKVIAHQSVIFFPSTGEAATIASITGAGGASPAITFENPTTLSVNPGAGAYVIFGAPSAADQWSTALPGSYAGGTAGKLLGDLTQTNVPAWVWAGTTRTLTGFSTALALSVWDVLQSAVAASASMGLLVKTNLDATITSRPAGADYTTARAAKLDNLDAAMTTRATPAQVNAEVVDVLTVDQYAELAALPPTTLATFQQMVQLLYQAVRLKSTDTATQQKLYKSDDTTVLGTATLSDDGSTFQRTKLS